MFAGTQIASLKDRLYGANIFNAINQGNIDKVKEILDEKPESIKQLGEEHRSPLHLAAFRGHTAIIELLLQRYTHTFHSCALFVAQITSFKRNADTNAVDDQNKTPFDLACQEDQLEAVKMLYGKTSAKRRGVHAACLGNYTEVLRWLCEQPDIKENIDELNNKGLAGIHVTAALGQTNHIEVLLQNGADVNLPVRLHLDSFSYLIFLTYVTYRTLKATLQHTMQ